MRRNDKHKVAGLMAKKFMFDWMRWDLRYSGKQAVCASAWDLIETAVSCALQDYEDLVNMKDPAGQQRLLRSYRDGVRNDEVEHIRGYGVKR